MWALPTATGTMTGLSARQSTGSTRNKESGLVNHKSLRGNQDLRLGDSWGSCPTGGSLSRLQRWMFYLIHRNKCKESRKRNKWENIFQTEEQDKYPETDQIASQLDSTTLELIPVLIKSFPKIEERTFRTYIIRQTLHLYWNQMRIQKKIRG